MPQWGFLRYSASTRRLAFILTLPLRMFFFLGTIVITMLLGIGAITGGAGHAMRLGWACTLITPVWMSRSVGGVFFDLRFMTFLVLVPISIWGVHFLRRFTLTDGLVLTFAALGCYSCHLNHSLTFPHTIAIVLAWVVPYFLGRLVVRSWDDLGDLVPYACAACIFLAAWAVFESVTNVNPLNVLVGRTGSYNAEFGHRMNLRRAEGPMTHPIFFGMCMAILMPFSLEGARRAFARQLPKIYLVVPMVCALGVFATLSRGPILVMLATIVSGLFFWRPVLRVPIATSVLASVIGAFAVWPMVVQSLEGLSGEATSEVVEIRGELHHYSGTKHRELLIPVYSDALEAAGWFGHGIWGTEIEHQVYLEPHLRYLFFSIDNHYVLLVLNWGIVGLIGFLAVASSVLIGATWLSFSVEPDQRLLVGSLTGSVAALMLVLVTVWFPSDFGFPWLCSLGMLSSCVSEAPRLLRQQRLARQRLAHQQRSANSAHWPDLPLSPSPSATCP